MKLLRFLHHRHLANPGDMTCSPHDYFDWQSVANVEVRGVLDSLPHSDPGDLVVGGGGLIGNAHFTAAIAAHFSASGGRRVLWGAGHNAHLYPHKFKAAGEGWGRLRGELRGWLVRRGLRPASRWSRRLVYRPTATDREQLAKFDLVGLRDWDSGERWVPCVSCMHPALDRHRDDQTRHDIVFADHPQFFGIEVMRSPKLSNQETDIETLVAFIASGRSVVTSSYHVAYWGVLLGRKVVIAPWSTKFLRFKWPVQLAPDLDGLGHHLKLARAYPEALSEARAANHAFAADVATLLGLPTPPVRLPT